MNIYCIDINESFCKLDFSDIKDEIKKAEIKLLFADLLSAYMEGYKFMPSYRAGLHDGKKKFYKLIGNDMIFPKGMWKYLKRKCDKNIPDVNFIYQSNTIYEKISKEEFSEFIKSLNLPFEPYDYQFNAAFEAINMGRLTIGAATSSGKSLMIYLIYRWMMSKGYKVILIVPNVMLTEQMYKDFQDYGMKNIEKHIVQIGGDNCKTLQEKKELFKSNLEGGFNIISTWQSLYNDTHLFETIDCLIVDEVQNAKSEVFSDIILPAAINCKYRFGFTGTMPPGYADKLAILGAIGPHKKFINAQGLINRGLATPVEIKMLFLNYNDEDKEKFKKIFKKNKYQEELKFIENHKKRNELLAKYINKISNSGNTLVMFTKVEHGKLLMEEFLKYKFGLKTVKFLDKITPKYLNEISQSENIPDKIFINTELNKRQISYIKKSVLSLDMFDVLEKYDVFLIYGGVEADVREEIRNILEQKESAIVFASYGTMSTGVSINRIHNIILASTTKSPIRLQQTVGRGMRKYTDKDKVKIWDFIDDLSRTNKYGNIIESSKNYCLKHSDERLSLYIDNGYPISDIDIKL